MIKAVLIDIDNTLLDFDKCAKLSIIEACKVLNIKYEERFFPAFTFVNDNLWLDIEKGVITKEQLHAIRFYKVFEYLNLSYDGTAFETEFRKALKKSGEPVDGAKELLEYLHGKYVVGVASNSALPQQIERLTKAGLIPYIDKFFVSTDIGYEKPSKEFFDACIKGLNPVKKEEVIMIGDSLTADIKGGKDFGLKTVWFKFRKVKDVAGLSPDYTVSKLNEIKKIL